MLNRLKPHLERVKIFKRYFAFTERKRELYSDIFDGKKPDLAKDKKIVVIILSIFIGILGAYVAILLRHTVHFAQDLFLTSDRSSVDILYSLPWWQRLLMPAFGGLLVGVITSKFAGEVQGSGIPQVMEAVSLKGGMIRFRVFLAKIVAASITIGSGGSAGREGPIVQIGSAIASQVGQILKVPVRQMRTFVACGAAAAVAATFNAPIAGALFALEVIVGDMKIVNMPPIVISAVIATVVSRHHLGDSPAFNVPVYEMVSPVELLLYAGLGVVAAVVALLFVHSNIKIGKFFDKLRIADWIKPAIGGALVGVIAIFLPHVMGVGYETIDSALAGRADLQLLILVLLLKIITTSFSIGSGGSGGIFAPSLFLGATLGAAWGDIFHKLFPSWTASSGAYALVGMAAVFAAVSNAPISAILIIFELTNDYRIIPPLMLASVISLLLYDHFSGKSIYIAKLESQGIDIAVKKELNLLRSIKVSEVMNSSPVLVLAQTDFQTLLDKLLSGNRPFVIVVGKNDSYRGIIELNDIRSILQQSDSMQSIVIAEDVADTKMPFVLKKDNLDLAMHIFGKTSRDQIAVIENIESKKVIGIITKSAVIDAYNIRIFQEDLTGGFCSIMDTVNEGRTIEILGGMHMGEIEVPHSWVGKTLIEADLRKKFELEIVLIHRALQKNKKQVEKRPGIFPSPDMKLEAGDKLLVIGTPENIHNIKV